MSIPALPALLLRAALLGLALLLPGILLAAEGGKFQFVTGEIKVISSAGTERTPVKGDSFNTGDTIVTGASGTAQIRMADGGLMAIRANTQLRLDQYVFNGREDGNERSLLSLVKGGFRAITGLIGNRNKDNYRIVTPNATIGIRGTDHEPVVIPTGATGGFQAGTYDRVYRGATIIETEKGKLIVNPNQVGFTPGKGAVPVILPKIPEFYDTKPQQPNAARDPDSAKDSGDSGKKSDGSKGDSARSLSILKDGSAKSIKDADSDATRTLRSPLDSSSTTTLKSDAGKSTVTDTVKTDNVRSLSTDALTPLTDTSSRATTTIDTSTTQIKTDALTAPVTSTLKSTVTTTTPLTTTTTTPLTTITTPVTTTIPKTTVETLNVPTTTIQKSLITK